MEPWSPEIPSQFLRVFQFSKSHLKHLCSKVQRQRQPWAIGTGLVVVVIWIGLDGMRPGKQFFEVFEFSTHVSTSSTAQGGGGSFKNRKL